VIKVAQQDVPADAKTGAAGLGRYQKQIFTPTKFVID
jgi:hypothetical protein